MSVGASVIDELFIRLGVVPDVAGLDEFKRKAEEATGTLLKYGSAVGAVLGAVAVKAVAMVGDEFEQNTNQIAGFLAALGVSTDFNAGLKDAEATIQQITRDAALLPGEASEYIEVFRAGLAVVSEAMPGANISEMTAFTNKLTAVGKSIGVDAEQIGRDLALILASKGRAGGTVKTFQNLLPYIHKVGGAAQVTAESFNAMTQPQRLALLQKALGSPALSAMLEKSATSFDAMKGAAISAGKQLILLGGKRLFEGMKAGLMKLGALFFDAKGQITATGEKVVRFGEQVGGMVVQAVTSFAALVKWLAESDGAMAALKVTVALLGIALAGLAIEKVAGSVGMLITSLTNLKRLLTGGLVIAIGLVADDLWTFYNGGESVTGVIVERLGPAAQWLSVVVLGGLAAALGYVHREAIKTGIELVKAMAAAAGVSLPIVAAIALVGFAIYELYQHWDEVVQALGIDWDGFTERFGIAWGEASDQVSAAMDELSAALEEAWTNTVKPAVDEVIAQLPDLSTVMHVFGKVATFVLGGVVQAVYMVTGAIEVLRGAFHGLRAAWEFTFGPIIAGLKAARDAMVELGILKPKAEQAELPAGGGVTAPVPSDPGQQGGWNSPYAPPPGYGDGLAAGTPEGPAQHATEKPGFWARVTAAAQRKRDERKARGEGSGSPLDGIMNGLAASIPAMPAFAGAPGYLADQKGGGATTITHETFNVGDVNVKLDGASPEQIAKIAETIKESVRDAAREKTSRTIRNTRSGEEH